MSSISTHILDTSAGKPAAGVKVNLDMFTDGQWKKSGEGVTDNDGRIKELTSAGITNGIYRLIFDTKSYFNSKSTKSFYPSVTIEFEITDGSHYHVPLLLNPFGYSTYRGS